MASLLSRLPRTILSAALACISATLCTASNVPAAAPAPSAQARHIAPSAQAIQSTNAFQDEMAGYLPQIGRLRKLHLVRPDLIYYPIDFEYLC